MRLSNDVPCRLARLLFAIVMALIWAGGADHAGAQTPGEATPPAPLQGAAAPAAPAPTPQQRAAAAAAQLEASLRAMADAERVSPRDTWDVAAVVQAVGTDATALFEWVRDQTAWVPYRGALRGDLGVLMDRVGNSLDRALLLAAMLKSAGHSVRLAHATLADDAAAKLLPQAAARLNASPPPPNDIPPAVAANLREMWLLEAAQQYGLDATQLRVSTDRAALASLRLTGTLAQRRAEQTSAIADALGLPKAPATQPNQAAAAPASVAAGAAAIDALKDHWWVQYRNEQTWTDLDALLPDAQAGRTLTAASETIDPAALPAEIRHQVEIRFVAEQWKDGRLAEHVVLHQALRPAELVGQPVTLAIAPLNWPADLQPASDPATRTRMKQAALAQTEWLPSLHVGTTDIVQGSVTASGDLIAKPVLDPTKRAGGAAGKGATEAAGLLSVDEPQPAAPAGGGTSDGVLTAAWLEYHITAPGAAERTIRRDVFDLVGPAARRSSAAAAAAQIAKPQLNEAQRLDRGLALCRGTEILLQPCWISPEFVAHHARQRLLDNRAALKALQMQDSAAAVKALKPLPSMLVSLAATRRALVTGSDDVYLARPNILTLHTYVHSDAAGQLVGARAFDIVDNEVAVRPDAGTDAARIRLAQGVLDTNAESLLLRDGQAPSGNTGELFTAGGAAAGGANDGWVTLRNANDVAAAGLQLPADVMARIAADLDAGNSVIAPRSALARIDGTPAVAWWRVDPKTGTALGIAANGWGAEMSEYTVTFLFAFDLTAGWCLLAGGEGGECLKQGIIAGVLAVLQLLIFKAITGGSGPGGGWGGGGGKGGGGGGGKGGGGGGGGGGAGKGGGGSGGGGSGGGGGGGKGGGGSGGGGSGGGAGKGGGGASGGGGAGAGKGGGGGGSGGGAGKGGGAGGGGGGFGPAAKAAQYESQAQQYAQQAQQAANQGNIKQAQDLAQKSIEYQEMARGQRNLNEITQSQINGKPPNFDTSKPGWPDGVPQPPPQSQIPTQPGTAVGGGGGGGGGGGAPSSGNPTGPNPTVPNPTVPNPTVPNPTVPNPTVPNPTVPNPTVPNAPQTPGGTQISPGAPQPGQPVPVQGNPAPQGGPTGVPKTDTVPSPPYTPGTGGGGSSGGGGTPPIPIPPLPISGGNDSGDKSASNDSGGSGGDPNTVNVGAFGGLMSAMDGSGGSGSSSGGDPNKSG